MFGPPTGTGQPGQDPKRIMVIYGTRPEAVKVAPLIQALQASPLFTPVVAVTAQHRSMLDQVNEVFGITPEFDLDIHEPGQTLTSITTRALAGVQRLLAEQRPDAVVVQGDTTTVFAAALDDSAAPVLLVTAHRRESWGAPMRAVGRALARIANTHPDLRVVFPVHANPLVREAVLPAIGHLPNVTVTEPVAYGGFARLMKRATLILTDSGGVQEEGPSLGKPVLVMRETTERPEAVQAGTVRLVGTDEDLIVKSAGQLLTDPVAYAAMAGAINPYGDGHAARRSVAALARHFGLGPAADEFTPAPVLRKAS